MAKRSLCRSWRPSVGFTLSAKADSHHRRRTAGCENLICVRWELLESKPTAVDNLTKIYDQNARVLNYLRAMVITGIVMYVNLGMECSSFDIDGCDIGTKCDTGNLQTNPQ